MPESTETLVESMRDLIEVIRTSDLTDTDLGWATAMVTEITDKLRPRVVDSVRMQHTLVHQGHAAADTTLEPSEFFPYSPLAGRLNPISPPVRMWRATGESEGEVHGDAVFRSAFNGPPGSVHGGVIAAVFDDLMGAAAVVNDLGAFTGTLSVVYRSPTPLEEKVEMRAWVTGSERRKVFIEGELRHGDTLCASATGIFIRSQMLAGVPIAD